MSETTVHLANVRKRFGPTVALDDCSLKASAGEVHAIIGGNGSGKSTLAKVLSGVLLPDAGQSLVLGEVIRSPLEARRLGVCNVFQEVLVAEGCSVLENLYLGSDSLFSASMNREDKISRARRFMHDLLGFDLDLFARVGDLPLSLKQWITIARGMLSSPKVLILDESSAALDYESTERLFRKMRELKAEGTTILIVTHRIAELVRIADRATVLRDGRDVGALERDEITEARILQLIAGPHPPRQSKPIKAEERRKSRPLLKMNAGQVEGFSSSIDFRLYPGEIVGVTGLDGQGQAEFVRALAGVTRLAAGTVTLSARGRSASIDSLQSARENRIAYISGDRKKEGIFPNLSIFENLVMPIYPSHRLGGILNIINPSRLRPIFQWECDKLAVKMGQPSDLITSLSGGNQQKVLIARAFAENPDVLILNDPARGIDVGAKMDLYRNLQNFADEQRAAVFLSSEIEEFIDLCTRVCVFRDGTLFAVFEPPFDPDEILNATFGQRRQVSTEEVAAVKNTPPPAPAPSPQQPFALHSPAILPGGEIDTRFVEDTGQSPPLSWSHVPAGTRSFALAVTDPDLPEAFELPRSFAHWLVCDIPADVQSLPEGASRSPALPEGAREFNSDFVTFGIPGFGRGYGGPWPPDAPHRYVFSIYALKQATIEIDDTADLADFYQAIMPYVIDSASFVAHYGPAKKPLPH